MEVRDLTRPLFRRWYLALPILLVSGLVAVLFAGSVEPDYRATGNMVLIPAPGDPTDAAPSKPGRAARPKNPWSDLGFQALGNAAILSAVDKEARTRFDAAGLSDRITVDMAIHSPIFIIEVIGTSPAQTTATVREVIKLLAAEVAAQQQRYGVMPQDTITTLTLTEGTDVKAVTSKVKRALIGAIGLGLLLTAAATIGLDALLRWHGSRRSVRAAARGARDRAVRVAADRPGPGSVAGRSHGRAAVRSSMRPTTPPDVTVILPMPRNRRAAQEDDGTMGLP
jgi:capsular polysaccharide biosynthesis protein